MREELAWLAVTEEAGAQDVHATDERWHGASSISRSRRARLRCTTRRRRWRA